MSAKKRPQRRELHSNPPQLTLQPEHAGAPIRSDKFPSVRQLTTLAALLSSAPPKTDNEAREAARAALRLWRATRDEINEQQKHALKYWQSTDENSAALQAAYTRIKSRLALLGASHLLDQRSVTWSEAAAALFPSTKARERDAELSKLVSASMVGQSSWSKWKLADFKEYGFDTALGFPSLVAWFDEIEATKEQKAKSERMSLLGKQSAKKKKERKEYGKLASPTSQRKKP
jgi:HrpA-like RNA helicase